MYMYNAMCILVCISMFSYSKAAFAFWHLQLYMLQVSRGSRTCVCPRPSTHLLLSPRQVRAHNTGDNTPGARQIEPHTAAAHVA